MAITSKPVQSKYPPRTFQRLIKFAIDHGYLSEDDLPFGGRTQRRIVEFVLKIDADPAVEDIKQKRGWNTLDIIQRAVHQMTSLESSEK